MPFHFAAEPAAPKQLVRSQVITWKRRRSGCARSADDDVMKLALRSFCRSLRWHYPDSGSQGLISAAENPAAPLGRERIVPPQPFDKSRTERVLQRLRRGKAQAVATGSSRPCWAAISSS